MRKRQVLLLAGLGRLLDAVVNETDDRGCVAMAVEDFEGFGELRALFTLKWREDALNLAAPWTVFLGD